MATTALGHTKPTAPTRLHEILQSWGNQSLWLLLHIDGENEEWIFFGLMKGLLIIGHDGSYMPYLANNVCSCTVLIYCHHRFFFGHGAGGKQLKSECRQLTGRNLRRSKSATTCESSGYMMPHGRITHSQVWMQQYGCGDPRDPLQIPHAGETGTSRCFPALQMTHVDILHCWSDVPC